MAPAIITIDPNDSSVFAATNGTGPSRTLLLAPPSLAAHADNLTAVVSQYDRSVTDLHMIDRISAGLVSLPEAKYDAILVLADAAGSLDEAVALLTRSVFGTVAEALKPEGTLSAQSGLNLGATALAKEAILSGLVGKGSGFEKPDYGASDGVVSLKLGSKKKKAPAPAPAPAGVGFDFGDDLDDDDIIDEETLMTEEDLKRPINIPPECQPKPGKRRKACKDCTCGLAERLAQEDDAKRNAADKQLNALKLASDDLTEVDFTVQGKVGSCGNCALGDAFRCDGCPYIGLPPFKPGEEVRILNNEIQL